MTLNSLSIVTVCMNRREHLLKPLGRWRIGPTIMNT